MSKRVFDVLFASLALVLLLPVLVVVAVIVKVDSSGPVFFRQERVGRHGRPFRIHKFRTMRVSRSLDGPQITVGHDHRVTRSGRILRKLKVDELPQLLDVLAGDMSIVGPRPEVPRYVAFYPESVRTLVLSVRPGITDTASILFRSESEVLGAAIDPERTYVEEILPIKLRHYSEYAQANSLRGDLRVIWQTVRALAR